MNIDDIYRPFLRHFRTKRMCKFWEEFGLTAKTKILDVGGTSFNWLLYPVQPRVTILNLSIIREHGFSHVAGDGRLLPFEDIVYSNSVIEHVVAIEEQRLFADECRRVGRRYYIQIPNESFFMEPHLITPFIHWLPRHLYRSCLRNFSTWGIITRTGSIKCEEMMNIHLLRAGQMKQLFPDARIHHEIFLGFTKSLIAVKN